MSADDQKTILTARSIDLTRDSGLVIGTRIETGNVYDGNR